MSDTDETDEVAMSVFRAPAPVSLLSSAEGADGVSVEPDDDEDGGGHSATASGRCSVEPVYDPAEYQHLDVGEEVRLLFAHITSYTPRAVVLPHRLRPFLPDYVPAIGDIDAFVRVPRPDSGASGVLLGLSVLDEPSGRPSDRHLLQLRLRSLSRAPVGQHSSSSPDGSDHSAVRVTSADRAAEVAEVNLDAAGSDDVERALDRWVHGVLELHRSDATPTVPYAHPVPDIDFLMQEWPGDVESALASGSAALRLPTADLQCSLEQLLDVVCCMLDVPVYTDRRLHSLHILFSLYAAFRQSAHFGRHDNLSDELI